MMDKAKQDLEDETYIALGDYFNSDPGFKINKETLSFKASILSVISNSDYKKKTWFKQADLADHIMKDCSGDALKDKVNEDLSKILLHVLQHNSGSLELAISVEISNSPMEKGITKLNEGLAVKNVFLGGTAGVAAGVVAANIWTVSLVTAAGIESTFLFSGASAVAALGVGAEAGAISGSALPFLSAGAATGIGLAVGVVAIGGFFAYSTLSWNREAVVDTVAKEVYNIYVTNDNFMDGLRQNSDKFLNAIVEAKIKEAKKRSGNA